MIRNLRPIWIMLFCIFFCNIIKVNLVLYHFIILLHLISSFLLTRSFLIFFKILNINFKKISFITYFIIVFYEIFIRLRSIFYPLEIFTGRFGDTTQPHNHNSTWRFFISIIIFYVFVISSCILINRVTYSSCYTSLLH